MDDPTSAAEEMNDQRLYIRCRRNGAEPQRLPVLCRSGPPIEEAARGWASAVQAAEVHCSMGTTALSSLAVIGARPPGKQRLARFGHSLLVGVVQSQI